MKKPLTTWSRTVALVPYSGVQFLDFGFNLDDTRRLGRSFIERPDRSMTLADGSIRLRFIPLSGDDEQDGPILEQAVADEAQYDINKVKALEPFLGKWVPVPYLRVRPGRGDYGEELLDTGPANWARALVIPLDVPEGPKRLSHRVVLAFDTEVAQRVANRAYLVPSFEDAKDEQEFRFAWRPEEMSWFLAWPEPAQFGGQDPQKWVDDWLTELFREFKQAQRPGRPLREEDFPYRHEHWARYLTFLELLGDAIAPPRLKLLDTISPERRYAPVDVDLVLDVGNSRTCGILIETYPDQARFDLNNSYVLELRDLERPHEVYAEPFESRVEFAQAAFGKEHIARRAGRSRSFFWPSLVRVGPEALRVASGAAGTEVTTGMSSPKRYLWSLDPVNQEWRFQPGDYTRAGEDPGIARAARRFINETGDVIRQIEAEEKMGLRRRRADSRQGAIRSKFSRSALYGFMISEIVVQALCLINQPALREARKQSDVPRRLRRIIITLPPATPLQEQRLMRSRAEGAVRLVWDLLGWTQSAPPGLSEPRVIIRWDEASCTHLVYLYTEITQKFSGQLTEFFRLLGRERPFVDDPALPPPADAKPQPSLRIASVDIGGGTTDLIITTYYAEDNRAIRPTQNFREGFKIAGDDILQAVIERVVLPALAEHLQAAGLSSARQLLQELFGGDRIGMEEQQKQLRRLFVTRVLIPIGLAMLHAVEEGEAQLDAPARIMPFAEFFGLTPEEAEGREARDLIGERVAGYLEGAAHRAGAPGFRLIEVGFPIDARQIDQVVRSVMRQVIALLAEAIFALECDIVLVTGRPSRLPTVADMLVELMPVTPDRLVTMHRYRVGTWYPFRARDNLGIEDPKSTVVVGAMLGILAEGQIENFSLDTRRLLLKSTARYVGEMELSGQILDDKLIFQDLDLDKKATQAPASAHVRFSAPLRIGFRQLPLERWMASPLYSLKFANPQRASSQHKPFTVTLERAEFDPDPDDDVPEERRQAAEAIKEEFQIVDVVDAQGGTLRTSDVTLRLQTLGSDDAYWLDTGILAVR
jgi:hypothetical protein